MSQVLKFICIVLVSVITTSCVSGTLGLPTPRRLGHYLSSHERAQTLSAEMEECELGFFVEEELAVYTLGVE